MSLSSTLDGFETLRLRWGWLKLFEIAALSFAICVAPSANRAAAEPPAKPAQRDAAAQALPASRDIRDRSAACFRILRRPSRGRRAGTWQVRQGHGNHHGDAGPGRM